MVSQYLQGLYESLYANSPEIVTAAIPAEMGTGQISRVVTRHGVILSDWHMNYASDMNVRGINSEAYVQIIFCLNEGVSWNIAGERQSVSLHGGEACIYRGHGRAEYLCYPKKRDFEFKSVKIPVSRFWGILNDYFESEELAACEQKLMGGISKTAITPQMERIFAELRDITCYRGGAGQLFLESRLYELLAVYLGGVLELDAFTTRRTDISRSDRASILEAKRIIDSQLAFAPGCQELARKVGLSTSKLMKGFSAVYGTSIHAYIIDQRLEKAAALLSAGDLNISEVSALVGYSKPGNFSAAFKKKFGVAPGKYIS